MKARVFLILGLTALMLGACSASDPSETSENYKFEDQGIQDPESVCQTDLDAEECLQDPETTSLDSEATSDPDENGDLSSAPPGPAGDRESSQEPTESSSQQAMENPTIPTESVQPPDTSLPHDDPLESPIISELPPQQDPEPETPSVSEPDPEGSPEPEPTEPEPTEPEPPAFDVQVWVDFAISYGQQIGLEYDAIATDCWDAPITASSQSQYLERDITSRLNRYLDRGMTGFSVWVESRSDGKYNLYIGYR